MELIPSLSTEYIERTMTAILDKADLDLFFQGIRSFCCQHLSPPLCMSVVYLALTILLKIYIYSVKKAAAKQPPFS